MTAIVGTAGWAIPRADADGFPREGHGLQRYAARLPAVEINSSFYRPHRRATWERWAAITPAGFRFAAKLPKTISHERRLVDCAAPLARFLDEAGGLGGKLAVLLLQLPPSLIFDAGTAARVFALLAASSPARIACEPRHPSWFGETAEALMRDHGVARVAADPAIVPAAAVPGGWTGLRYHRLHGSPLIYRSDYGADRLDRLAATLGGDGGESWCIFDNTASGAALGDALGLLRRIGISTA